MCKDKKTVKIYNLVALLRPSTEIVDLGGQFQAWGSAAPALGALIIWLLSGYFNLQSEIISEFLGPTSDDRPDSRPSKPVMHARGFELSA